MALSGFRDLRLLGAVLLSSALAACGGSPTSPSPSATALKLTGINPATGSTTTDTTLTLTGTGFSSDATVNVGGVAAKSVTFVSATTLTVVAAGRAAAGAAAVDVTSGGKTASLPNGFTYVAPSGANRPPVITQIRSTGSRPNQPAQLADVGENITLAATVSDSEATDAQLAFEWSAPGTFSPQAATTTWQVGSSLQTPSAVTVSLQVTETFVEGGVTHKQASAPATLVMQVHDSQKEILDRGQDFLTLFSNSSIPSDQVLHNFSATCDSGGGRQAEKSDTDRNRRDFIEDFAAFRIERRGPATFSFGGSCSLPDGRVQRRVDACSSFAVHWEFNYRVDVDGHKAGERGIQNGIDYVSAVFENNEWKLCHSDFIGTATYPALGITVPVSW